MRVVREPDELPAALAAARREALAAFGDGELLLERYVERPRHVEVQVLADRHGACLWLGERECTLQRRYQKVVEEAPAPHLDAGMRDRMGEAAVALARAVGYTGVGTCEFLVDGEAFAFLEMNTRLQVEHPVTELVTGLDLVEQQLRVAAGERLAFTQDEVAARGHAIEARVYAEDPDRGFLPTGGRVLALSLPSGPGVRVDIGIEPGTVVGSDYDPMLGKVIAGGSDRDEALRRLDSALAGFTLLGVKTNVAFLRTLLAHPDVRAGRLDTGLIARLPQRPPEVPEQAYEVAARVLQAGLQPVGAVVDPFDVPSGWRVGEHAATPWRFADGREVLLRGRPPLHREGTQVEVELEGETSRWQVAVDGDLVWVGREGGAFALRLAPRLVSAQAGAEALAAGPLRSPLPGTVRVVAVAEGERVAAGQTVVVVEAMKMEHPITAPVDGVVAKVLVRAGQRVPIDAELAVVEPSP
jgi:acetyl-CoA/propionyl-CoA carboxylase biotin carboxyl carrier protein